MEDAGSFMTMSITEDFQYLIVIVGVLGILAVITYYFVEKNTFSLFKN